MTITQLSYIVAVEDCGNFVQAAKDCFVSQSTLSMQIKKLEEELNIQLFDRSKKPVQVTHLGNQVIQQARVTLNEVRRIHTIIESERAGMECEVKLGIIPTLSPYLLPQFVVPFVEKYPEVNLVISEMLTEDIVLGIYKNELDIGIMVTPVNDPNLMELPMFYEAFVGYFSNSHPLLNHDTIKAKDLNLDQMWLMEKGHCFRNQVVNICREPKKAHGRLPVRFESGSLETLRRIVESQYGYTLLPEMATMDFGETQQGMVRHFKSPKPIREVSLVAHRNYVKRNILEMLKAEIQTKIPAALLDKERGDLIDW